MMFFKKKNAANTVFSLLSLSHTPTGFSLYSKLANVVVKLQSPHLCQKVSLQRLSMYIFQFRAQRVT
jgi:hypothetical protein